MEVIMQEREIKDILFSLDQERFDKIWTEKNWFKLQLEFKTKRVELSQSLLIWVEESGDAWLLTDFENQKTYYIENKQNSESNQDSESNLVTQVSELSDQNEHLKDTKAICSRLQQNPQTGQRPEGTHKGFTDLLQRLDLEEIDAEGLKRSNLSGSELDFESVHPDLLVVYDMFRVILTLPREELINLPHVHVENVKLYLPQFYEITQKIEDFDVSGENPTETHADLLKEVSDFCGYTKGSLSEAITYLKSTQIEQLENQVNTAVNTAEEKVNTAISSETEKSKKISEEAQQNEEKRKESFDQIYVQLQNQLAEKPVSQYKEIFSGQAKKHGIMSWIWLIAIGGLSYLFIHISGKLIVDIGTIVNQEDQLITILASLFTKGFYLSLIFLILNRVIKNFAAEKHLEVINTHRQNALETFDTFVAAAEGNRETRDAVLLAATRAIFEANQSGYLSAKTSSSDTANPVQQIIKEVIPSKSSADSD